MQWQSPQVTGTHTAHVPCRYLCLSAPQSPVQKEEVFQPGMHIQQTGTPGNITKPHTRCVLNDPWPQSSNDNTHADPLPCHQAAFVHCDTYAWCQAPDLLVIWQAPGMAAVTAQAYTKTRPTASPPTLPLLRAWQQSNQLMLLLQAHLRQHGLRMQRQPTSRAICLSLAEAPSPTASMTCMCWTPRPCTGPVLPPRANPQLLEQVNHSFPAPSNAVECLSLAVYIRKQCTCMQPAYLPYTLA